MPADISLESKIAFLRQPRSFPEPTFRVEAVETHMSWVFLTDAYAYKLKKPVHYDLLDFSTLEARHYYCEEEVRLNRRLAPTVYLGVAALGMDQYGDLQLEGKNSIVDWLVKMRRLPASGMLDYALRHAGVSERDLDRVAARLADFYRNSEPIAAEPETYRGALYEDIDRTLQVLSRPDYRLPAGQVHAICRAQQAVLKNMPEMFDARVRAGKIVEGHGDLRPEHICIEPEVAVIDCLEFSRKLRIVDAADEMAFLALECERLDAADAGTRLLHGYSERCNDRPSPALLHFYQCYRACLRARISISHLDEEKFRYSAEWRRRAGDYLQLAQKHQDSISSAIEPPVR